MAIVNLEKTVKPVWTALHAIRELVDRMEQGSEAKNWRSLVEELNKLVDHYSCERLAWYAGIITHSSVTGETKSHVWQRFQHELSLGQRLIDTNDVLDTLTVLCERRWRDSSFIRRGGAAPT
jgi:hypothetical protein